MSDLIYRPENYHEPEAQKATLGVKFCQDTFITKYLLDKWNIPYTEKELEDGPWGKVLRIKKDAKCDT